jgi:hypothetical protein
VSWRDLDLDEHDPRCLAASWLADDAGPSNVGLLIGSTGAPVLRRALFEAVRMIAEDAATQSTSTGQAVRRVLDRP